MRHIYEQLIPFVQKIFSVSCAHCQDSVAQTHVHLCVECAYEIPKELTPINIGSDVVFGCWALGPYHGPLGSLVRMGKYASKRHLFQSLGEYLAGSCLDLPMVDAVISVPIPWPRMWKRGFNQSEIIAVEVSRLLDVPHMKLLERRDFNEQASRSVSERVEQITGRFYMHPKIDLMRVPERVLIVDDVLTTGATIEGCAVELLNFGVKRVFGVAITSTRLGP